MHKATSSDSRGGRQAGVEGRRRKIQQGRVIRRAGTDNDQAAREELGEKKGEVDDDNEEESSRGRHEFDAYPTAYGLSRPCEAFPMFRPAHLSRPCGIRRGSIPG
jgi:hypothetical protein